MKKTSLTLQWLLAAFLIVAAVATGVHYTSLLLLAAAALSAPIPKWRNFLNNKLKYGTEIALTTAAILIIAAALLTPLKAADPTPLPQTTSPSPSQSETAQSTNQAEKTNESPAASDTVRTAQAVHPDDLPVYGGKAFVVVNDNQPVFSKEELTAVGYERYADLDKLGRCGAAVASCGKDTMPSETEQRGSISSIKPSGWVQAKYKGISGGYLWNRCHLIGWQLSAENANRKNLITGTRYMNTEGMLPFENMVADYIKETGHHVAYRVTPIFKEDNLVCNGVQIEAQSVEDGEICFNVYCYNVQPGIVIDYKTGESSAPGEDMSKITTESSEPETQSTETETVQSPQSETVWIPRTGKKYHRYSSCSNMVNPSKVSLEEAQLRGYGPCKKCY